MARPTLLLDCYLDDPGAARNFLPALGGRDVRVVRPVRDELPPDPTAFEAVLVSGSAASAIHDPPGWVSPLEAFIAAVVDVGVPYLGVCFGHQLLASALHGRDALFTRDRLEIGWRDVVLDPTPMHAGFGGAVTSFVTHFDEVRPGLPGLTVTGRSSSCPVEAMRLDARPAWSVQFHPEMRYPEAEALVRRRSVLYPDHIPDPEGVLAAAPAGDDDRHIRRLVDNFFAATSTSSGVRGDR